MYILSLLIKEIWNVVVRTLLDIALLFKRSKQYDKDSELLMQEDEGVGWSLRRTGVGCVVP